MAVIRETAFEVRRTQGWKSQQINELQRMRRPEENVV